MPASLGERLPDAAITQCRPDERDRTTAALKAERDLAQLAAAKAGGESGALRERMEAARARADRVEALAG